MYFKLNLIKLKLFSFQVFFFMLTGRMVIDWQLRRKAEAVADGEGKTQKQD